MDDPAPGVDRVIRSSRDRKSRLSAATSMR